MRDINSIREEFESDLMNEKLDNSTLEVKYLKSIIPDQIKETEKEEDKTKLDDLLKEIKDKIENREGFATDILNKITKINEDITKGFRVIDASRGKYVIKFPSIIDDEEIEYECSKFYNKLFREGEFLTEKEILNQLEVRGVWTEKDGDKLEKLLEFYKDSYFRMTSEQLKSAPGSKRKASMEKIKKLSEEVKDFEKQYSILNDLKAKHIQNSLESRVDELRLRTKLIKCVFTAKEENDKVEMGDRLWNSVEDIKKEPKSFIVEIFREAQSYWSGVDPSFLRL